MTKIIRVEKCTEASCWRDYFLSEGKVKGEKE